MSYDPYAPREAEDPQGYSPIKNPVTLRDILRKLWAPIAAIGFLFWKLKFVFAAIFKFKLFTVAGSMLLSIGAYALLWGWQFAVGFVVLLFVHEMGHVLEAKRQGLPVSAPMFIPFLGALITLKRLPDDAWNEAKVAIAGPIIGGLGAAATWGLGVYLDSDLLVALAFTGFFLNLFNLAPISPLDGGRIVAAIHPVLWIVGLLVLLGLTIVAPNPILILILIIGGLESYRRWQHRKNPEGEAYYRVTPSRRVITGIAYIAVATLLTLGMSGTFVERDI
ncbi:MAG: site-2 protease family protein [Actinomycetota bacterium]|nr:site-2 protease family protein [Actinomycetota bacterium]